MITLIAAIGRNREIGYKNELLWKIPADMAHFKLYTTGKPIVMGRSTYESIGRPLPNRLNVVLTTQDIPGDVTIVRSVYEVIKLNAQYPEIVIIGGGSVYNQFIGIADKLVITHVNASFTADTFFPEIDPLVWKITSVVDKHVSDEYEYGFVEYSK